ncbi:MAG: DNA-directed RNA polymerase subunit beta' [Candidatus Chisholmbacteria bacterium RIFCSPHIGHO2_01_FULL_49_18]|uniref:DNA-directed RNA polymerase subunit beta' n=2 Tax=Candidatus Chisholmiibacteriota TaxID=1817900 RepID=A0A1G1VLV0_9BACT|nr:MAG: DNA-directed RNA polymerase subunit beta' [Candidatus Chisholmbacteria bacterium RIFCSPHIGHO2_01_FULL_49_18]OGY19366.1 MAG: DNA-directed RNA polymerase subunit beta' [Candidatus Chisholmbacteria bacterium RIFCSPLOWO2_01_FULL_49_14]
MKNIVDFKGLQIKLASPETISSWSHGEITKPETINYRTLKPEKDGLFCERIFGPTKDWECYCGKYKRIRYRGIICDKCGVEVTQSRVRRERMGHVNLAAPVAHVWFFKGTPSKLSLLLDISPRNLASVIYFAQYIVLNTDEQKREEILKTLDEKLKTKKEELEEDANENIKKSKEKADKDLEDIKKKVKSTEQKELTVQERKLKTKQEVASMKEALLGEQQNAEEVFKTVKDMVRRTKVGGLLSEDEYLKLSDYDAIGHLEVGMGAEAILKLIGSIELDKLTARLREQSRKFTGQRQVKATKRLRVITGLKKAGISPLWMILRILPVIPPDLRPMVQLSGGRFATSDLNDLYRRVINRNNRLKHLIDLGAPEIILRNEKRMLQEAVDALIDASQSRTTRRRRATRQLRSLSDMLRGKQGRFRQNLLGKRADYSGRSVIIVGPELNLNQCGLPKEMALEMFKPYVLRELIMKGIAPNVKSAKHILERRAPEVYDILENITSNHPVLLNRAPTLHKLGIQAFFPILVEGNAIQIHPCICAGFNADFDGDQMAVHIPLGKVAREEAEALMMPKKNLLKPADGSPITIPNKEMALGCYYLTSIDKRLEIPPTIFGSEEEAILALQTGKLKLRQRAYIRIDAQGKSDIIETTVGRVMFNARLPQEFRFINTPITLGEIKELVRRAIASLKENETTELIDNLKNIGFNAATRSGLSIAVSDNKIIPQKNELIEAANQKAEEVQENYKQGLITDEEKKRLSNEIWMETTEEIAERTWQSFEDSNAVKLSIDSGGTRASKDQVKQLAAMRGLVVDPLGKIVELPTKSNFREGLSVFEYVTSARGSRKGLTDSALKTADAGYLTRRLVDVAHDVIIREPDCQTDESLTLKDEGSRSRAFWVRVLGRIAAKKILNPKTRKTLVNKNEIIDEEKLEELKNAKINIIQVRSPLTCEAKFGLCQQCYGWDFSSRKMVEIGTPVGVIAAQSIGEPGTQLTMRVKHTGGIVGLDVTQGLPRVEELFEARTAKIVAPISEIAGRVSIEETAQGHEVTITATEKPVEEKKHLIPITSTVRVKDKDLVGIGDQLASGSLDIKEVLRIRGLRAAQEYLVSEIQSVYESQGIPINDRHFEVIIRKMSGKGKIESAGDTSLLPGELIDVERYKEENEAVLAEGGEPATAQIVILGITRASLYTESWLSAASFQETTSVLTEAAILGKVDHLLGLKENVIIGRLIPVETQRAEPIEPPKE